MCFYTLRGEWIGLFIERKLHCIITFFFFHFTREFNRRSGPLDSRQSLILQRCCFMDGKVL